MNGKKAKKLRSIAQAATIGLPNVNYVHDGDKDEVGSIQLGKCTRKLYKLLKKAYKNGSDLNGMVSTAR